MNPKYTFEPKAITHLEADINYTVVYRECGSKEVVSYTLKRFEEMFSNDASFVRIHKGFIVNRLHICQIMKTNVVMTSGTVLPLARRRKL